MDKCYVAEKEKDPGIPRTRVNPGPRVQLFYQERLHPKPGCTPETGTPETAVYVNVQPFILRATIDRFAKFAARCDL